MNRTTVNAPTVKLQSHATSVRTANIAKNVSAAKVVSTVLNVQIQPTAKIALMYLSQSNVKNALTATNAKNV